MADTYTQIHLHIIFAVKYRKALIQEKWADDLYKYIFGIIRNNNHHPLAVNGVEDHIHILLNLRPHQSLAELMKGIKVNTSKWINKSDFISHRFQWQNGYSAFAVNTDSIQNVIKYIKNQRNHHTGTSFNEEYVGMLDQNGVKYWTNHLLKPPQ